MELTNSPHNTFNPVFFRTYSRFTKRGRESWTDVVDRSVAGLRKLGLLEDDEARMIRDQHLRMTSLPSGRWMWVGGTPWLEDPKNYSGAYNCTSTDLRDVKAFALMMDLAMMGSGTGAIIEPDMLSNLPEVRTALWIKDICTSSQRPDHPRENTSVDIRIPPPWGVVEVEITVGDSRHGWVQAYEVILRLATRSEANLRGMEPEPGKLRNCFRLFLDLRHVRPSGAPLKGFGGTANPVGLPRMFSRVIEILNGAYGRKLNSVECCLLIDEAASAVVAGNIRRSAGMRQFAAQDTLAAGAKDNLWQQRPDGSWRIDPKRDALRMANHTRVFHRRPTLDEIVDSVTKQYHSGEGAIQFAPEALARANADLLSNREAQKFFIDTYCDDPSKAGGFLWDLMPRSRKEKTKDSFRELDHRMGRYGLNPCGEIIGRDFHCNLAEVHLNNVDPLDGTGQANAFKAAALSAASLLRHEFCEPRYRFSREQDPIVGVSFTGMFDFFVKLFGVEWLRWCVDGRGEHPDAGAWRCREKTYLERWRETVEETVQDYCGKHGLKVPNRCTTVQPAGTKSLLTGASPGWHAPKSQRFIRRITFRRDDPVALACIDYGFSVIPSQSDKDKQGRLLDDPYDPLCTEWLVEIPVEVPWANLKGCDGVDLSRLPAVAQLDLYMQVQTSYTRHNTSGTIELRESEIKPVAERIHQAIQDDEGYISVALLARLDDHQTFPRLPFEPIDREEYERRMREVLSRRKSGDFLTLLRQHDMGLDMEAGPSGCDSDKCLMPPPWKA